MTGCALTNTNPAEVGALADLLARAWREQSGDGDAKWRAVAESAVLFFVPPPPALTNPDRLDADARHVLAFARRRERMLLMSATGRRLVVLAQAICRIEAAVGRDSGPTPAPNVDVPSAD